MYVVSGERMVGLHEDVPVSIICGVTPDIAIAHAEATRWAKDTGGNVRNIVVEKFEVWT